MKLLRAMVALGAMFSISCVAAPVAKQTSAPQAPRARILSDKNAAVVLGYYPSWETGVKPADLVLKRFTHICHSFLMTDVKGNLKTEGNMPSADLIQRSHAAGTKVLISLGGAGSGATFNAMTRDRAATDKYVNAVMAFMIKNNYDGLDMDWEAPENEVDKGHKTDLMRQFRARLDQEAPGSLLTMALPASDWSGKWIDAPALLPLVDFVNVMTYDYHGPWSSQSGHNAALYPISSDPTKGAFSTVDGMKYWTLTKKFPKNKLVVGIPLYGRGFAVPGLYQATKGKKSSAEEVPYKKAVALIKAGWVRHWDKEAGAPYLVDPKGTEMVSYDDIESVTLKGQWAAQQGYRGIFYWEVTEDLIGGEHVLVNASRDAFFKK